MTVQEKVDCFLLHENLDDTLKTIQGLGLQSDINHIYLLAAQNADIKQLPENTTLLSVESPVSTAMYLKMATMAEAPYVLLCLKTTPITAGARAIDRFWKLRTMPELHGSMPTITPLRKEKQRLILSLIIRKVVCVMILILVP